MTDLIPTATSMKARFPEFVDVADATLEFAIEEARQELGDGSTWTSSYTRALMYLSAHYVVAGQAAAASSVGGNSGEIASENWGRFSISYKAAASANAGAAVDDVTTSSYGRRFAELRESNFGGPVII